MFDFKPFAWVPDERILEFDRPVGGTPKVPNAF